MMFAVEVCSLPVTGGATGVAVAAIFLLVLGVVVARWVRASAGRVSIVAVVPLLLLGIGAASTQPSSTSCNSSTVTTTVPEVTAPPTTVAPTTTTTVAPVDPNMVLQIDTSMLPAPSVGDDSMSALDAGFVYELGLFGVVAVHIDWGDSSSDDVTVAGPFAHTYEVSGQYTITVSGSLTGFGQSPYSSPLVGAEYLVGVSSFGDLGLTSLDFAFWGANNLVSVPSVLPSTVVSLEDTFWAATLFNDDISSWDTQNVTNMTWMFEEAASFNGDISDWDTSSVVNMSWMFSDASSFAGDISDWNTISATNMSGLFQGATSFNGVISNWNTSSVTDMSYMFYDASAFNGVLSDWNTSSVTDMNSMFNGASVFDRSLSLWDTSSVTDMSGMFAGASSFDQSLSLWDTSSVTDMSDMFSGASAFDQSLSSWDVSLVTNMQNMLDNAALSTANFEATLNGWALQQVRCSVNLGASGLTTVDATGRSVLENRYNWIIGGLAVTEIVQPSDCNLVLQIDTSPASPGGGSVGGESVGLMATSGAVSNLTTYIFELGLFGAVNVSIDWGDNTPASVATTAGVVSHTYATSGQYEIRVSGTLTGFGQSPYSSPLVGAEYLVGVSSFGDLGLTNLDFAFWGANNLVSVPSVLPNTVVSLEDTFWAATLFNDDISSWDTANVTNMSYMFSDASAFNKSLNSWDTSSVTDMSGMFEGASMFNQSLNLWDTSNVTDMNGMFYIVDDASAFNQSLNLWDTSKVTDMNGMFDGAESFNQSLSSWNTSSVTDMSGMFHDATSFNQSLGAWDIGLVVDMEYMLDDSALSVANYDATLDGWSDGPKQQNVTLGANNLQYYDTYQIGGRNILIQYGWNIVGDGMFPP
jgi:surface protein